MDVFLLQLLIKTEIVFEWVYKEKYLSYRERDHDTVCLMNFFVSAGNGAESGYFGPWRTCKYLQYGRERCGRDESRFRPSSKCFFLKLNTT